VAKSDQHASLLCVLSVGKFCKSGPRKDCTGSFSNEVVQPLSWGCCKLESILSRATFFSSSSSKSGRNFPGLSVRDD